MKTNIKVLGWLHIVFGILGVLLGLVVLLILMGVGWAVPERDATAILFIVGIVVMVFAALVSAPGIVVGIGLLQYRSWARVLALVLAFLNLPTFPLGTILGVYTLVSLLNPDVEGLFS